MRQMTEKETSSSNDHIKGTSDEISRVTKAIDIIMTTISQCPTCSKKYKKWLEEQGNKILFQK